MSDVPSLLVRPAVGERGGAGVGISGAAFNHHKLKDETK
jgi:hypothetical protein